MALIAAEAVGPNAPAVAGMICETANRDGSRPVFGFLLDLVFGRLAVLGVDDVAARWKLGALRRGTTVTIYGTARFPGNEAVDEEAIAKVSPGLISVEARMGRPRRLCFTLHPADLANLEAADDWARYAISRPAGDSAIVFGCKVEYSRLVTEAAEAHPSA